LPSEVIMHFMLRKFQLDLLPSHMYMYWNPSHNVQVN